LLAEYPNSRKEIIRAWALLFPWDANENWEKDTHTWLEKIQKDDTLNRNKPSDPSNESLQFKLKIAEIAMAARDANQFAAKAKMLKALFPKELEGFEPEKFDPKQFSFSQSVEKREEI
jgi:hypothetical protein